MRAARLAAQQGAKVAVMEKRHWGGTCVNLGCVPKKLLVYASDYARALENSSTYGFQSPEIQLNWDTLRDKIGATTSRLQEIYKTLLNDNGVDLFTGVAKFTGPQQISCDGQEFTAPKILVATGSKPFRPNIPGAELALVSDDVFSLPKFPESLCVVGGGYIALEFANMFAALGSRVTLIHRSTTFLQEFDQEQVKFALERMENTRNLKILRNTEISAINAGNSGEAKLRLGLKSDAHPGELETEQLVFATGRIPNIAELELESLGNPDLLGEKGKIKVDDFYQTKQAGLFAVGDVIAQLALTPVAIAEAKILIAKHFGGDAAATEPLDYDAIPMAVFCRPELARLGLTEEGARANPKLKNEITISKGSFTPLGEALKDDKEERKRFFMKLVYVGKEQRLAGVHLAGDGAAEMIQGFAAALHAKLTRTMLDKVVGIHPTNAEELFTLNPEAAD